MYLLSWLRATDRDTFQNWKAPNFGKSCVSYFLWSNKPKCAINCASPHVSWGPFCKITGERKTIFTYEMNRDSPQEKKRLVILSHGTYFDSLRLDRVVASSAPNQSFNLPSVWCTSLTLHLLTMRDQQQFAVLDSRPVIYFTKALSQDKLTVDMTEGEPNRPWLKLNYSSERNRRNSTKGLHKLPNSHSRNQTFEYRLGGYKVNF